MRKVFVRLFVDGLVVAVLWGGGKVQGQPVINEFLANNGGGLESEWTELYNPDDSAIDLGGYEIGDALGWRLIADASLWLEPGEYIVLAQNADAFLNFYFDYSGNLTSPVGWPVLNNSGGETVRLRLAGGETVDSFYYTETFPDNRSWERYVDAEGKSCWGRSYDSSGSTPGRANTFYPFRPTAIDLSIAPDPFSPDGDGLEDKTFITYNVPDGEAFDLSIYDISGRRVAALVSSGDCLPGQVEWDGHDENGQRLPLGIYVVVARLSGSVPSEQKLTVVIAR